MSTRNIPVRHNSILALVTSLAIVALLLPGCSVYDQYEENKAERLRQQAELRAAYFRQECGKAGFESSTVEFSQCVVSYQLAYQRDQAVAAAAEQQAQAVRQQTHQQQQAAQNAERAARIANCQPGYICY